MFINNLNDLLGGVQSSGDLPGYTYDWYIEVDTEINRLIHELDGKISQETDPEKLKELREKRQELLDLQGRAGGGKFDETVFEAYRDLYDKARRGEISEDEVTKKFQELMKKAEEIYNGKTDPKQDIDKKYHEALDILNDLKNKLQGDSEELKELEEKIAELEKKIADLEGKASNNPEAQRLIEQLKDQLQALEGKVSEIKAEMKDLQAEIAEAQKEVDAIKPFLDKENVNDADVAAVEELLEKLEEIQQEFNGNQSKIDQNVSDIKGQFGSIEKVIAEIKILLDPHRKEIQDDYDALKKAYEELLKEYQKDLGQLKDIQSQIDKWQKELDDLRGKLKDHPEFQGDFDKAKALLDKLQGEKEALLKQLEGLKSNLDKVQGAVATLEELLKKDSLTEEDLNKVNELIQGLNIDKLKEAFANFSASITNLVSSGTMAEAAKAVKKVEDELSPKPKYDIEHGTWYIDWRTWDYPIPDGVDVVNIFVGDIIKNADGTYSIGGFGNMSLDDITKFISKCHEKGIKVKISLGGTTNGGKYGQTWEKLLDANGEIDPAAVNAIAEMLAKVCGDPADGGRGADGIDFDFEDFVARDQGNAKRQENLERATGKLIQKFKELTSDFKDSDGNPRHIEATLCSFAGFDTWKEHTERILDPDGTGETLVDRLYLMSYYRSSGEELADIAKWAEELHDKYGFSNAQIGIGIDTFDGAHAGGYDKYVDDMAQYAKDHGFSTEFWAWDPSPENDYKNIMDRILHPEKYDDTLSSKAEEGKATAQVETGLSDAEVANLQTLLAQGA